MTKRTYKVGTFYEPHPRGPVKSRIRACTVWYNTEWKGCVEYEVEAGSGAEAKAIAIEMRLSLEQSLWRELYEYSTGTPRRPPLIRQEPRSGEPGVDVFYKGGGK